MSEPWLPPDGWTVLTPCAPLGRETLLRSIAPALGAAVDAGLDETYVDVVIAEAAGYDDDVVAAAVHRALPAVGTMSVDRWADALAALLFHPRETAGSPGSTAGPAAGEPAGPELVADVRARLARVTTRHDAPGGPDAGTPCGAGTTDGAHPMTDPASADPVSADPVSADPVSADPVTDPVTDSVTDPAGADDAGPRRPASSGRLLTVALILGAGRVRRTDRPRARSGAGRERRCRPREAARTIGRWAARAPPRRPDLGPRRPAHRSDLIRVDHRGRRRHDGRAPIRVVGDIPAR